MANYIIVHPLSWEHTKQPLQIRIIRTMLQHENHPCYMMWKSRTRNFMYPYNCLLQCLAPRKYSINDFNYLSQCKKKKKKYAYGKEHQGTTSKITDFCAEGVGFSSHYKLYSLHCLFVYKLYFLKKNLIMQKPRTPFKMESKDGQRIDRCFS